MGKHLNPHLPLFFCALSLSAEYLRLILPKILPFLIVKRKRALLVLKFLRLLEAEPKKVYNNPPRKEINLEQCKKLYLKGWTQNKLAKRYKVDATTISNWLRTMGIKRRHAFRGEYPPEILQIYREMKRLNAKGQRVLG